MHAQLARRAEMLASGRRHLGWKVGFGSAAAMQRLGLAAPLVGFLTDGSRLETGATCRIAGWTRAVLEPEIAAYVGRDVPPGADRRAVLEAISALGVAIEVADSDPAVQDVEAILAGDIFHRFVVLGPPDATRAGGSAEGVTVRVVRDGNEVASTESPEANTGRLGDVLASVAATLHDHGLGLRRGDVVITGSTVPPIEVHAGEKLRVEMQPLGALELDFA